MGCTMIQFINKKNIFFLLLGIFALLFAGCSDSLDYDVNNMRDDNNTDFPTIGENEGRVVFTVTDEAVDMNTIEEVSVTIDSIMLYSDTQGWITVSDDIMTFNLLELKNLDKSELFADVNLEVGNYSQIRLDVVNATVVETDGDSFDAKIPSSQFKINANFEVNENSTNVVEFDFRISDSIIRTGTGQYIITPVIGVYVGQGVRVQIEEQNRVRVMSGEKRLRGNFGMDLEGNVGQNVRVPANVNVSIGNNGEIIAQRTRANIRTSADIGQGDQDRDRDQDRIQDQNMTYERDRDQDRINANVSGRIGVGIGSN